MLTVAFLTLYACEIFRQLYFMDCHVLACVVVAEFSKDEVALWTDN